MLIALKLALEPGHILVLGNDLADNVDLLLPPQTQDNPRIVFVPARCLLLTTLKLQSPRLLLFSRALPLPSVNSFAHIVFRYLFLGDTGGSLSFGCFSHDFH